MSVRVAPGHSLNTTNSIDITIGTFHIGDYRVPFLTSILRAQQAEEYLNLVTDDPKYAQQDWSVEELFQREISYGRAIDIADSYLNPDRAKRPPFFDSLTVVLVPNDLSEGQRYNPPEKHASYENFKTIGPIGITYSLKDPEGDYPAANSFGKLQWNRDEVCAVAIDGQHRLAAIKHLCEHNRTAAKNLYISILFIIIDRDIGFLTPDTSIFNPIKYMRSIFVDLNKHAVSVSRARRILLDDFDPMALFVRGLVSPSLDFKESGEINDDYIPIGENKEFYNCLPLDIVDWHSESKSKVDEGPYLTSILGLDWIVNAVLSKCNNPKLSPIDISKLDPDHEQYYEKLENIFKPWGKSWEAGIEEHLKQCETQERTFILNGEELKNLQKEFCENWGKPITRLLTTTGCYSELVRERIDKEIISPKFGQWYQLKAALQTARPGQEQVYYRSRLDIVVGALKKSGISIRNFENTVAYIDSNIKNNRILFFLVAQRALVYSLIELLNENKIVQWAQATGIGLEDFDDCPYDFCAFYLTKAINSLYSVFSPETDGFFEKSCKVTENNYQDDASDLRREFWAGSLTKRDNPTEMDFSDAAARRGAKWFALIAHLYWFLKRNEGNPRINKQSIIEAVEDDDELEILPFAQELRASFGAIGFVTRYNESPMQFLGGIIDTIDEEPEIIFAAAKERVGYLCDLFIETGLLNNTE